MGTPLAERIQLYIIIDTADEAYFAQAVEYFKSQLPEDEFLRDFSGSDYDPGKPLHIVDTLNHGLTRWESLFLATQGVRVWSDDFDVESPVYAGELPEPEKFRRILVDAQNADTRAAYFKSFGVNYLGRTKLNPRNMFVLDNKKDNPIHHPDKDPVLEALYASLPDDWWGSCGFVSSPNVDRLEAFLESFAGDTIFLAFTPGAYSKLKFMALDYVDTGIPKNTEEFGIMVRDKANRLSYKLALPEKEVEPPKPNTSWLQL